MRHGSLFSGIGGPEVAAAMLGWQNAFHCEINPFGRQVLEYWFPESVSYEDITKTDFTPWRGLIDVLTGGFPCQPFSYAGKRGGQEDERYLWPEMLRVIEEVRPTWVVGENVAGLATMVEGRVLSDLGCEATLFGEEDAVHGYMLRETFTIERICQDLERVGYSVQPVLIPAAAVGAPHRRDRIFIVAHHNAQDPDVLRREDGTPDIGGQDQQHRDTCSRDSQRLCSEAGLDIADAYCWGLERAGEGRNERAGDDALRRNRIRRKEDASHADHEGLQESQQPGRREDCPEEGAGMDDRTVRSCGDEDATNTFRQRLETAIQRGCNGAQEWDGSGRYVEQFTNDAWTKGTWWNNFPTVSPVHAGNDGIPFRMDGAAIPFSKWRTESIKAYGNAIVPQVMYRIFQAIQEVEQ